MTLVPSDIYDFIFLHFRNIKLTTKWRMIDGVRTYAAEATMASYLPAALVPDRRYWTDMPWWVVIQGEGFRTVEMGQYFRAMPGDQIIVTVWVAPGDDDDDDDDDEDSGKDTYQTLRRTFESGTISAIARQEGTDRSLRQEMQMEIEPDELLRNTPEWFEKGKFGIFMHWGVYAVPGWARTCSLYFLRPTSYGVLTAPGPYAEWYWYEPADF